MKAARARDVTVDGLTRVAAVVAAMAESDQAAATAETAATHATAGEGSLKDLIAKAAQAMAGHAHTARRLRSRGLGQQERARESLRIAVGGKEAVVPRKLDLVR